MHGRFYELNLKGNGRLGKPVFPTMKKTDANLKAKEKKHGSIQDLFG